VSYPNADETIGLAKDEWEVFSDMGSAMGRMAEALEKIAAPDLTLREMRAHAAETDHVLQLRLLDLDVFGVSCSAPNCPFRTEWRTA
jgi:hypothetical protein